MSKRVHWRSALIGGLVAGLVMTVAPVVADVGEALILGQDNSADARTNVTGSVGTTNLRLQNSHPSGSALALSVVPGNPPLKVGSSTKVKKLNVDKVDGLSAHQLIRVAHAAAQDLPNVEGAILSVDIKAPFDGFVFISGGLREGQTGTGGSLIYCWFEVDGLEALGSERRASHNIQDGVTQYDSCESSITVPVTAGTHTIDLVYDAPGTAPYPADGSLTALYIPFDGFGKKP